MIMSSLCAPGEPIVQVVLDKYEDPGVTHNLSCADLMSMNQYILPSTLAPALGTNFRHRCISTDNTEVGHCPSASDPATPKLAIPRKRPSPVVLEDIDDPPMVKGVRRRRTGDTDHIDTQRRDRALTTRESSTPSQRASRNYSVASSAGTPPSDISQEGARGRHQSSDPVDARSIKAASVEGDDEDKLALRRARNRVAAYKSRAKKSKEISHLEEDMQRARDRRAELSSYAEELKSEVFMLKNEILLHGQCEFPPIKQYLMSSVMKLGPGLMQTPMPPTRTATNLTPLPQPRMSMNRPI